ncbi:MAG: hypothetical protein CMF23_06240 [Ignavibacteriae bacterium]|jgi:hypothetical protein|nr:hypothetical protein [Ignavibacteriota bacterium]
MYSVIIRREVFSKMNAINQHIAAIKQQLNQVLFGLNGINDYNFDEKMELVNQRLLSIKHKREEMLKNYDKSDLQQFNSEFENIIKEINNKFDNMIKERTELKNKFGEELKVKQNEKKLVNYKR